jgi:hypothetical protein
VAVALVGTVVTGQGDGAALSIASGSKVTTTGNCLVAFFKYEGGGPVTTLTDTAGNSWSIVSQGAHSNGILKTGIAYALDITGDAANVLTAGWPASGTGEWRRIFVYEFSGVETASALDDNDAGTGTGTSASTPAMATSQSGVAVAGVGGFTGLSGITAGGTPAFTHLGTISDSFLMYLISASAQSVTPGASWSPSTDWYMRAIALKGIPDAPPTATVAWITA